MLNIRVYWPAINSSQNWYLDPLWLLFSIKYPRLVVLYLSNEWNNKKICFRNNSTVHSFKNRRFQLHHSSNFILSRVFQRHSQTEQISLWFDHTSNAARKCNSKPNFLTGMSLESLKQSLSDKIYSNTFDNI